MNSRHLRLTFPELEATEPVIYHIVKKFDVVPCIRRASIENHFGWMVLSLEGEKAAIEAAIEYLEERGIGVTQAEGDILAG